MNKTIINATFSVIRSSVHNISAPQSLQMMKKSQGPGRYKNFFFFNFFTFGKITIVSVLIGYYQAAYILPLITIQSASIMASSFSIINNGGDPIRERIPNDFSIPMELLSWSNKLTIYSIFALNTL